MHLHINYSYENLGIKTTYSKCKQFSTFENALRNYHSKEISKERSKEISRDATHNKLNPVIFAHITKCDDDM